MESHSTTGLPDCPFACFEPDRRRPLVFQFSDRLCADRHELLRADGIEMNHPFDTVLIPEHAKGGAFRRIFEGHFNIPSMGKSMEELRSLFFAFGSYGDLASILVFADETHAGRDIICREYAFPCNGEGD